MRPLSLAILAVLALPAPAAAQSGSSPHPHRAAETAFPARVGQFQRTNVHNYDPGGQDISASYELQQPDGTILVTVYVYPVPKLIPADKAKARAKACKQHLQGVSAAIRQSYREVDALETGAALPNQGTETGLRRSFRFVAPLDGEVQPLSSELSLYCFVKDRWMVKYRATWPEAVRPGTFIEDFIRRGPWPGIVPVDGERTAWLRLGAGKEPAARGGR